MPTLDWIGKKAVVNHHREVPYRLLHCDKAKSVGDPDAGNLLVQGDNLEALKALLPYYAGKVKCIYIDPPYNTGNEGWVYNDNVNSPEIKAWLGKVVGREAEDLSRHDKWLCMMYPRLRLLREFLRTDGLIFVSVDENEYRHLALLMDSIFDSRNRIETLIWKKSYGGGAKSKHIVNLHEYIECFALNIEEVAELELPPSDKVLKYYKYRDSKFEKRGPYRLQPLATNSMDERPNLRFAIEHEGEAIWPEKQWQWEPTRVQKAQSDDELMFNKRNGKWSVNYKQYLRDENGTVRGRKLYSIIEGIYTQSGTNTIRQLLGDGKAFDFPKPHELVRELVALSTDKDSIVLDSFAGSGTTGHAVVDLNASDEGRRRFVLVEGQSGIAANVTAKRLERIDDGGFRFCTLGEPLFDENGSVNPHVTFPDLAAHIFFCETGSPIPKRADGNSPLIGTFRGRAIYLLYAADSMGFASEKAGNVLNGDVLARLPDPPPFTGEGDREAVEGAAASAPLGGSAATPPASQGENQYTRVVYAEGCTVPDEHLRELGVTFKQVPYQIEGL